MSLWWFLNAAILAVCITLMGFLLYSFLFSIASYLCDPYYFFILVLFKILFDDNYTCGTYKLHTFFYHFIMLFLFDQWIKSTFHLCKYKHTSMINLCVLLYIMHECLLILIVIRKFTHMWVTDVHTDTVYCIRASHTCCRSHKVQLRT